MKDRHRGRRLAGHASDSPSLKQRIEDMERRLMVERAQAVAHAREFRGSVWRRIATPTNLLFAGSVGFVTAEILGARSAARKSRRGGSRTGARLKSAGKSLFGALVKPLLSMAHLGTMGLLVKHSKEASESAQVSVESVAGTQPTLH